MSLQSFIALGVIGVRCYVVGFSLVFGDAIGGLANVLTCTFVGSWAIFKISDNITPLRVPETTAVRIFPQGASHRNINTPGTWCLPIYDNTPK